MSREIYLDHEDHGTTVVYQVADAETLEKRGWKRRGKDWVAPKKPTAAEAAESAPAEVPAPKKSGRKPKA